jgi:pyruvate dehydrogenase E2 component (dihydrolipoamide acetyltransferase)
MRVTLSCDHRTVDGLLGAKFLQEVKRLLENPLNLLA